ncbi:MAG: hypothetical protein RKL32_14135 [Gammaproteobacteria bacterium]
MRHLLVNLYCHTAGNASGRRHPHAVVPALVATAALWAFLASAADAAVSGATITHLSPAGTEERCIILDRMPGATYSEQDRDEERRYCDIDFNDGDHGLCPKVFSTSPGTLVYDIARGPYNGRAEIFENEQCAQSSPVKRGALGNPVMYKMTMNDAHTSATFATASLLYYHFSRYLDAAIHVPVSVYRSMDKDAHLARVSRRGFEISAQRKGGAMNHAGWRIMRDAEQDPATYHPTDELFTADRQQIYGVLLQPHGDRYGPEFNGTRRSGWGAGQSRDFQQTAPFRALRSARPLAEAIEEGVHAAVEDPGLRHAMQHGVAPEQMVYWMQELTEITLLDYIFSQQDRIGNIDFLSYWYWLEDGVVKRMPAAGTRIPESIAAHHPLRLRRTQLNDNDAGGRVPYANFTKQTQMLENIRHYSADTYRRLLRLDSDFAAEGELFAYVRDTFGLSTRQFEQIVKNTRLAAAILRNSCNTGRLRFDLDPPDFLAHGEASERSLDCAHP